MTRRLITALLPCSLATALAACSTPEAPVRSGLISAGIPQPIAACMAPRMVRKLSLLQLRRMSALGKAGKAQSIDQFVYRLRSLNDERIVEVTASSAALCAVGLG